jgi:hypothetical protein
MKQVKQIASVAVLALFCCAAMAQDVHTDYDKKANFSQYHTYYWAKVKTTDPLWEQRIQDAVDRSLQAKGWQKVQSDGDVALTAVGSSQTKQEYQTFYDGMGGWRWRGFGDESTTTEQDYKVGSLVLDLYDGKSKQLVWRGTASDTLSKNPEHNEKELDKAVAKMFKNFPPKEKG